MLQAMEWLCHKRKGQQQKQTEISPRGLTASCTSGPQDSAQCHLESPGLPVADPLPPHPPSLRPQEPQGPLCSSLLSPRRLGVTPLLTTSARDPGSALLSPPVLAEGGVPDLTLAASWTFLFCGPSVTGTQDMASALSCPRSLGPAGPSNHHHQLLPLVNLQSPSPGPDPAPL